MGVYTLVEGEAVFESTPSMLQSRLKPRRLWDFIAFFPAASQDSTCTRKLQRVHHRRFDKIIFL